MSFCTINAFLGVNLRPQQLLATKPIVAVAVDALPLGVCLVLAPVLDSTPAAASAASAGDALPLGGLPGAGACGFRRRLHPHHVLPLLLLHVAAGAGGAAGHADIGRRLSFWRLFTGCTGDQFQHASESRWLHETSIA